MSRPKWVGIDAAKWGVLLPGTFATCRLGNIRMGLAEPVQVKAADVISLA
jgi:hypothetical protein